MAPDEARALAMAVAGMADHVEGMTADADEGD